MNKVINAKKIAELISDNMTIAIIGSGGAVLEPDEVYEQIEASFLETGHPSNLTLVHTSGIGDKDKRGVNRFAHKGMVRRVIGGHWGWSPRMQQMAINEDIEAYNLPQGSIACLFREIAAKRPGLITKIGLSTFVDPRLNGAALNRITPNELVELIKLDGEEWLRYKPFPVDIAIIRGTAADPSGNITMEQEAVELEALAMAQAAHNSGGKVICQVKYLAQDKSLDPMLVKIPGIFVDYVVVVPEQKQTRESEYNPAFRGQFRAPAGEIVPMPLTYRKVISRRAAMELCQNSVVNLGFGMPDGVASVIAEEGKLESITLSVEQGVIGGIPAQGDIFGVAWNPEAIINEPAIFDFYSGNGLDITFLGLAQADENGNVNVSKFGTTIAGCGGFIDISQSAKKVVFCGTFTAGGMECKVKEGKIHIQKEGRIRKFIREVEQITFSGDFARRSGQEVLFVTERAVFRLTRDGLALIEIAPGIDLENDILAHMDFTPETAQPLKVMDARIFEDKLIGLDL